MGRRKDPPGAQKAKGYPGRRKTKAEKQDEQAQKYAALLATAPAEENGDILAPPAFMDSRFAGALVIWKEYVPRLTKLNLFEPLDRHTFALFCVYLCEWVIANEEIQEKGYSVDVKTVSGDMMPRENPAVGRRDNAFKFVMELSKRFGLTQLDRYALMGHQASSPLGGLFDRKSTETTPKQVEQTSNEASGIGVLRAFDSAPPTDAVN